MAGRVPPGSTAWLPAFALKLGYCMGCLKRRLERRFIDGRQVASRCALLPPTPRDWGEAVRCLLAVEVTQINVEHQIHIAAGRIERREYLARGAKSQPVKVGGFESFRQRQSKYSSTLEFDGQRFNYAARFT